MNIVYCHHAQRAFSGSQSDDLTEFGRRDAELVGELMAQATNVKAIYTSPYYRCAETARIINKYVNVPIIEDERFNEYCSREKKETWVEVQKRIIAAIEDIVEKYKAMPPEIRDRFLEALDKDEANFIKPLCITLMFAGLRIGEALALKWKNIDFNNKTIRVERAITQVPKFDEQGNIKDRITVIGDTKTTCSVRDIPVTDIVIETLKQWKDKQNKRQQTNPDVTAILTSPTSFVFANDDGSYRTYSGTRKIFDRFKRRNGLNKFNIHFHGLRHTFSNMLFEMNENPKVIQQLLGHRDVKTTITVYNSVNSDYVREATDRLNTRIQEQQKEKEVEIEKPKDDELTDEEIDRMIKELERKKKRKEKDFEM